MNPQDITVLNQLPVAGIVLIAIFKMMKDNRKHQDSRDLMFMKQLESRDLMYCKSIDVMSATLRNISDRVHALGVAFVALASEDGKRGAKAAKEAMNEVFNHTSVGNERSRAEGYGD